MRRPELTPQERQAEATRAAGVAIERIAAGRPLDADRELVHAVHSGVRPSDLVAAVVDQTGGRRP